MTRALRAATAVVLEVNNILVLYSCVYLVANTRQEQEDVVPTPQQTEPSKKKMELESGTNAFFVCCFAFPLTVMRNDGHVIFEKL